MDLNGSSTAQRVLPLLMLALLLAASIQPPAAAQTPELRIPSEYRRVQADWIQEARQDLDQYARNHNLSENTVRQLHRGLNSTEEAYREDRWQAVVGQLVALRVGAVYSNLARQAHETDQPQEVYLGELDPQYQNVTEESREVRGEINSTAESVSTVRGLESLYLGAQLLVQGNQQLQQYPQFRQLVAASGNDTAESIFRTLVSTVVGARWNFHYARDMVELSKQADQESRSEPVDAAELRRAWETVEEVVDATPQEGQAAVQTRESLNFTTSKEDWLLSTALGERYILSSIRSRLGRENQQDRLNREQLQQDLADKASNLTLLVEMEKADFGGVGLKDQYKSAYDVLDPRGNTSVQQAIDAFAGLEATGASSRGLLAVAEASSGSTGEPADEGFSSLQAGFMGAVIGALVGAGAVYVALEGRRRP